ncbi:IS4 family transposase [Thermodesulfobacteriota bacterium]
MIIAWRILYVTMLGRSYPNLPCDVLFDEEEWKAVYIVVKQVPPPTKAPPLDDDKNDCRAWRLFKS